MNLGTQIPVMPTSSAAAVSWNSTGAGNGNTTDRFPAGLRVLVVDDDPTCLMILEKMLRNCKYEVTKCNRAEVALSLLRENKNGFDVVISDVHMPDMDGFKLLVHIGLEMDLPVIMMSADDSKSVVMKGVTHGACDYLIKPVRIEALRNIWQHVVRKKKHEWKDKDNNDPSTSLDDGEQRQQKKRREEEEEEDPEYSSSANEGYNWKNAKRKKDDEDEIEERDDSSSLKKPRVVWTQELHQQFVAAVNQLGIDKAVPKKILDLMNVPGLTRENVASHLQKYRLYLRRLSGSHQSGGINPSFMGNSDAGYSQLSEFDLQALAASGQLGQLPAQSLATLQAALGRSSNSKSIVDQRNFFSFENPMRYTHTQVQNRQGHNGNIISNNNNINKMNLLHGIPTTMEPKQLVGLQRSFVGMNSQTLIPMTGQSQTHVSRQPVLPSFPTNNRTENTFSLRGSLGISSIMPTSTLQNKSNNWSSSSQGNDLTFAASTQLTNNNNNNTQGGLNALQHNYTSGNRTEGSNVTLPTGEGSGTHILQNPSRQPFFPDEYSQDDLLSTILPQQQHQEEIVQAENEFGFDWYSLDNLPV